MTEFSRLSSGDVSLRARIAGSGPLVILVHGFPESWHSWRHQIEALVAAGYRVCAFDVRGYGGSSRPWPVEAYSMEAMIGDVVAIVKQLQPEGGAVLVGHDWGAPIVWNSVLVQPELFSAVCGLSVPFAGVPARPGIEVFDERFTMRNRFFYQVYFQEEGRAERDLEAALPTFLAGIFYALSGDAPPEAWPDRMQANAALLDGLAAPERLPSWLSQADLEYYCEEFRQSGLRGPLNRYRNHRLDYRYLSRFADRRIEHPALFIGGDRDLAFNMYGRDDPLALMRSFVPNVETQVLAGCGHWTQQERPTEVNEILIDWLARVL